MSMYDPYPPRSTRSPLLWPILLLLVLGAAAAWRFWPHDQDHPADATPRLVAARGELAPEEESNIQIYKRVSPSVVHITNLEERQSFFSMNAQQIPKGTGSGFMWNDDGIIVTNYHVVQDAAAVRVILADKDRSTFEARTWMSYPDKDLAVLRIDAPKDKLHPIPIGTSHDLQIGQRAYAIGNPFGLDQTLTVGIVSALGREIESVTNRPIRGVIQISAAINPGNSGGPLLDSAGRLIGMNTAILSPSGTFAGIGFAIPVDEMNRVVPKLIEALNKNPDHGEVTPPRLGVKIAEDQLARELGVKEGALIIDIVPDSPAAKAGLRPTLQDRSSRRIRLGDIIVAVDDDPVKSSKDLYSILEKHQIGDDVTLAIIRDKKRTQVTATLEAVHGS